MRALLVLATFALARIAAAGPLDCVAVPSGAPLAFRVNSADDVFDGSCDAAHCSLREAIAAANFAGGEIDLNDVPGPSIAVTSPLPDIIAHTVLTGGCKTLTGALATRLLTANAQLDAFQVRFANNPGGAIHTTGVFTCSQCVFADLSASDGAAIEGTTTSAVAVADSVFEGNTATNDGGAIHTSGALDVLRSSFVDNTAANDGGAIHMIAVAQLLRVMSSLFDLNTTTSGDGGAIYAIGTTAHIHSVTFSQNTAGAGAVLAGSTQMRVASSLFAGNTPANTTGFVRSADYNALDFVGGFTATIGPHDRFTPLAQVGARATLNGQYVRATTLATPAPSAPIADATLSVSPILNGCAEPDLAGRLRGVCDPGALDNVEIVDPRIAVVSAPTGPVRFGEAYDLTFEVSAVGAATASGVLLQFPSGIAPLSCAASAGAACPPNLTTPFDVPPGETLHFTRSTTSQSLGAGSSAFQLKLAREYGNTDRTNDSALATVTFAALEADVGVRLEIDTPIIEGETKSLRVCVDNHGPDTAPVVCVSATNTLQSAWDGTCSDGRSKVIGLGPGVSRCVSGSYKAPSDAGNTSLSAAATARASDSSTKTIDPNAANNAITKAIEVVDPPAPAANGAPDIGVTIDCSATRRFAFQRDFKCSLTATPPEGHRVALALRVAGGSSMSFNCATSAQSCPRVTIDAAATFVIVGQVQALPSTAVIESYVVISNAAGVVVAQGLRAPIPLTLPEPLRYEDYLRISLRSQPEHSTSTIQLEAAFDLPENVPPFYLTLHGEADLHEVRQQPTRIAEPDQRLSSYPRGYVPIGGRLLGTIVVKAEEATSNGIGPTSVQFAFDTIPLHVPEFEARAVLYPEPEDFVILGRGDPIRDKPWVRSCQASDTPPLWMVTLLLIALRSRRNRAC